MLTNKSIIDYDFKPLTGSQTVEEVLQRLEEQEPDKLPVVEQTTQKLIGQISIQELKKARPESTISEIETADAIKIYRGQHIFEAARLMLQYEMRILPVVDKEWTFLGIITKRKVLESLSRMLNVAEFGSVITIELDPVDFSLSEIVQLIETEGAKILGITVEAPSEDQQHYEVSIKLNLKEVTRVVASLRRYNYAVISETEAEVIGSDLETRADELIKYMDM